MRYVYAMWFVLACTSCAGKNVYHFEKPQTVEVNLCARKCLEQYNSTRFLSGNGICKCVL